MLPSCNEPLSFKGEIVVEGSAILDEEQELKPIAKARHDAAIIILFIIYCLIQFTASLILLNAFPIHLIISEAIIDSIHDSSAAISPARPCR
jgi:hypothetical protein